ncbi:C-type lectin lectoxin-Lio3-like [Cottoperca gobio]|uniref:C-type lectin lectoxin-Lio3-like n=1 Tax=Cottoperca gobio TaxID=56716 RepID=A0A6J2RMP1_COTGO|nr:C-type lectin lectoxin-Lio3-like [Cottoperca gobio]
MMEDSFWRVKSCTLVKMPLICFRDAEADPYVLVTEEKSWFEAQSYCRRHHTDLVSVTSQSENQKVRRRLKGNQTVPEAWIGLRRDSWRWSDGSSYSFTKWGLQPVQVKNSKACASMQNGKWNKWKCDEKLNFLCQKITEVTEPGSISQAERRSSTVKMKLLTNADLK